MSSYSPCRPTPATPGPGSPKLPTRTTETRILPSKPKIPTTPSTQNSPQSRVRNSSAYALPRNSNGGTNSASAGTAPIRPSKANHSARTATRHTVKPRNSSATDQGPERTSPKKAKLSRGPKAKRSQETPHRRPNDASQVHPTRKPLPQTVKNMKSSEVNVLSVRQQLGKPKTTGVADS